MKFMIIDVNNLVHRAKHVVTNYETFEECVGLVLTIVFSSFQKVTEKFHPDHCVACFDSSSWRKEYFAEYKGNRKERALAEVTVVKADGSSNIDYKKLAEQEEQQKVIEQVLNDLYTFFKNHTNVTTLSRKKIEADDFISRWIQLHSDDGYEHVIVSGDGDFKQLVKENVHLFNPLTNVLMTLDGIFFQDGKRPRKNDIVINIHGQEWKVKMKNDQPEDFDPAWELFFKCIRGDSIDNIKSAYPRVRETAMRAAFNDRGGLEWNNFINSTYGPEDNRVSVRERYEFNQLLIDLTKQPDYVVQAMDEEIIESVTKDQVGMVGAYFAKFCGKYRLDRVSSFSKPILDILSAPYEVLE